MFANVLSLGLVADDSRPKPNKNTLIIKFKTNMDKHKTIPPLSQTTVSGSFTIEDMIGFADWCRNGLTNVEYSIDKIHEHLEAWILQHRKDVITLKIEFEDWHYQCGDKCCDNYGTDIYLNDKKLDEQYAEDSRNALKAVLSELGYNVELNYR
jgi:hypothetical protein